MAMSILERDKKLFVQAWGIVFRPKLRLIGDGEAVQTFTWVHAVPNIYSEVKFEWQLSRNRGLDSVEDAIKIYFKHLHDIGGRPAPRLAKRKAIWVEDKK